MNDNPESNTTSLGEFFNAMEEHITELRKRLLISVAGLVAAVVICFFFSEPIMNFLCRPIGGLNNLTAIEITENVSSVFDVALLAGFILAFPLIAYEAFAFILPGLETNEKAVLSLFNIFYGNQNRDPSLGLYFFQYQFDFLDRDRF